MTAKESARFDQTTKTRGVSYTHFCWAVRVVGKAMLSWVVRAKAGSARARAATQAASADRPATALCDNWSQCRRYKRWVVSNNKFCSVDSFEETLCAGHVKVWCFYCLVWLPPLLLTGIITGAMRGAFSTSVPIEKCIRVTRNVEMHASCIPRSLASLVCTSYGWPLSDLSIINRKRPSRTG